MAVLGDWDNARAVVLSCPGPLRRHTASLLPAAGLALPQMLLGAESQLLAFAGWAAKAGLGARLVFAPFPEMFHGAQSLALALPSGDAAGAVHLRFGGVRAARLLKGARNACVLAERAGPAPLTASHHPFASGYVVPAAMERAFALDPRVVQPTRLGGGKLPVLSLPDPLHREGVDGAKPTAGTAGLDFACLAYFRSDAWAAGLETTAKAPNARCVLLPWNMDHPGSIVGELLERLSRLHGGGNIPNIVLLPFNYIGQTGIIRDLIARLRDATDPPGAALATLFIARARSLAGIGALLRIASTAWVDGNDPEHWWTLARMQACGFATLLIDPAEHAGDTTTARLHADEALWVEAETRSGALIFPSRLPSLRTLPNLLALTASLSPLAPARRPRRGKPG